MPKIIASGYKIATMPVNKPLRSMVLSGVGAPGMGFKNVLH